MQANPGTTFQARMTRRYGLGLVAMACLILLAAIEVNRLFSDHVSHAGLINVAGEQRMLSQKIALHANAVVAARTAAERDASRLALDAAIDKMRDGHGRLTNGDKAPAGGTPELAQMYSPTGANLDHRVRDYLSRAGALAGNLKPTDARAVLATLNQDREALLATLDQAVRAYEAKLHSHLQADIAAHQWLVVLQIATLLALALLVFRPMIKGAARAYEKMNRKLDQRTQLLSHVLRAAKMGHWQIASDRPDVMWLSGELIALQRLTLKEGFYPIAAVAAACETRGYEIQAAALKATMADGLTRDIRLTGYRGDGVAIEMAVIMHAVRDESGAVTRVVGIQRDITEEVETARTLASNQTELNLKSADLAVAQRLGKIATWRWRFGAEHLVCGEEAFGILGYDPQSFDATLETCRAICHPDDLGDLRAAISRVLSTASNEIIEARMRRADGAYLHTILRMTLERDGEGNPTALIGSFQDVSEAKAAAEALEKSRSDLAEAQALGKAANWRFVAATRSIEWTEATFSLFALCPKTFKPSVENNRGIYVGGSNANLRGLYETVKQTRAPASTDVQVLRGDGKTIDVTVRAKPEFDDTGALVSIFGTYQDVTDLRAVERELQQLAYFDNLTGLANRVLFKRDLKKACERAQLDQRQRALVLLDLDHFKDVNDSLGHAAGDELLQAISQRLAARAGPAHLIARLGGDEFAILVNDSDGLDLEAFAQGLLDAVAAPLCLSRGDVVVSGSAGVVAIPCGASEPDEAMRCADLALYAAKEAGRCRALRFNADMSAAMQQRLSMARDLRLGLVREEFIPYFQPIIDLKTKRVSGFEALLRWRHPTRGFVSPAEFIPIAESSHLIADLGGLMMKAACASAQTWVKSGLGEREVSVNVSAAQVWHGDLEATVDAALMQSGLDPRLLCIELTESVFAADALARLEGILTRLKARGVRLALDDFGTGYSSLGYLNRLPFDKLKVDRCFVAGADHSASKLRLLRGIVELGRGLDMQVVAEGVETEGELAIVTELGCDLVQGWHYGKALPEAEAVIEAARFEATAMLGPFLHGVKAKAHRRTASGGGHGSGGPA